MTAATPRCELVDVVHGGISYTGGANPQRDLTARDAVCQACGIQLHSRPPSDEVTGLTSYVREALGEQDGRLSAALTHRLLARDGHERLGRFIQVVEVNDLSGLANVLDDELTRFIGALLREAHPGGGAGG